MRGRTQGKREERENRPNGKMPRLPPVEPLADDALLVFIFPASASSFYFPLPGRVCSASTWQSEEFMGQVL